MEFRKIKFNSKEDVEMQIKGLFDGRDCLQDCKLWVCKNSAEARQSSASKCVYYWNSKGTIWT